MIAGCEGGWVVAVCSPCRRHMAVVAGAWLRVLSSFLSLCGMHVACIFPWRLDRSYRVAVPSAGGTHCWCGHGTDMSRRHGCCRRHTVGCAIPVPVVRSVTGLRVAFRSECHRWLVWMWVRARLAAGCISLSMRHPEDTTIKVRCATCSSESKSHRLSWICMSRIVM